MDTVYEVCIAVTDALGSTASLIVVLASAQVLFRTAPAVDGLSIGKYLTEAATLIVGGLIKHLQLPGPAAVLFDGKSLLDYLHPVGSIFQSTASTSPADLFGGTWEQVKDRFLLAAGDSHAAGSTGGEEKHVLTAAEMANHTHGYDYTGQSDATGTEAIKIVSPGGTANAYTGEATSNCGGQAHNNMPPYLAVYTWRRTA